jgi:HlyD family secretion protein
MHKGWILGGVAAAGLGAWYASRSLDSSSATAYRTSEVERGDLVVAVTATGTVQPVTQVQVGTQVTGTVQALFADFNSRVTQGQIVAQIDPATFKARVESDRANLIRSQAESLRVAALLKQAERDVGRQEALVKDGLVTASEYDAAVANRDSLLAQQKVAEASISQMQAALTLSEVNLQYTTISSPVDGTVISRSVDVGQTVSASLSAPTLFVIAADLTKMQVQASVAEADIGRIAPGQRVRFDVDAYPELLFDGSVSQVRLAPTTVQNVVTYTVLVEAPNPEEKLLPGMTANLSFEIERRDDVLTVADSALRFTPPDASEGEGERGSMHSGGSGGSSGGAGGTASGGGSWSGKSGESGGGEHGLGHRHGGDGDKPGGADTTVGGTGVGGTGDGGEGGASRDAGTPGRVWILADGVPKAVDVMVGPSDGQRSALLSGPLAEGDEVIIGLQPTTTAMTGPTNPFQPQMGGRPGGGRSRF